MNDLIDHIFTCKLDDIFKSIRMDTFADTCKISTQMKPEYCKDLERYSRRKTSQVSIGGVLLGSNYPVRLQSMTTADTCNTKETIAQIVRIANEGADLVRLTVPGRKDAENLENIKAGLLKLKCNIPLIADIHFNPKIAEIAASIVEKVRINPGNYIDKKLFKTIAYSDEQYNAELIKIQEYLIPLINICKKHHTALRIGSNHGSLSDRIVSRYGDTPIGLVESVMEFLRICNKEEFNDVVVSIKASNARIMVYANRLLVSKMLSENMHYPLHLGVTEAGEGEDGRIKSAVGIGTLLSDGLGDTIRVSLSEDPEREIPVARKLVNYFEGRDTHKSIPPIELNPLNHYEYNRREIFSVGNIGKNHLPVVIAGINDIISVPMLSDIGWTFDENQQTWKFDDLSPDYLLVNHWPHFIPVPKGKGVIIRIDINDPKALKEGQYPLIDFNNYSLFEGKFHNEKKFIRILASDLIKQEIDIIKNDPNNILVIETNNLNGFADQRAAIIRLINQNCKNPVILYRCYQENIAEDLQLKSAADFGGFFIDGLADGIWLESKGSISKKVQMSTAFGILQASRVRVSKTEYISCPSCGRTLFDLQRTIKKIQEKTSHLKSLKIGIMGCIVNGPGEMADADYGYVGSGKGHITLYKGQHVVKRNIPEFKAVDELISLIKENGDWVEP